MKVIGFTLCLALAGITGVAAFAEYEGTVALEWAPQGGSQRLVAYVEASYVPPAGPPPDFGSVNFVKFEVQTGNGP